MRHVDDAHDTVGDGEAERGEEQDAAKRQAREDAPQDLAQGEEAVATFEAGKQVVAQSGCLACHKIDENGNDGPGPPLTEIGARLPAQAIARTLVNPTAPMPSFKNLAANSPDKFQDLVFFLSQLKGD